MYVCVCVRVCPHRSKQVVAVTKAKEAAADTDTPQQDTATEPVPVELAAS